MNDLIIYNGRLLSSEYLMLDYENRSFKYGDGFFETIRLTNGNIPLLTYHFNRILQTFKILKFDVPDYFTVEYLLHQINRLQRVYTGLKNARIRITFFRNGPGFYTPTQNDFSYLIQVTPLTNQPFSLNSRLLNADFYNEHLKPCTPLSNLKSNNALIYVLAGYFKQNKRLDEAIILNQYQRVCEGVSSNIFIIMPDKSISTPPLSEGCLNGVMRAYLLDHFKEIKEQPITPEMVLEASECFFTNSIGGLLLVERINNKTYHQTVSSQLAREINNRLG